MSKLNAQVALRNVRRVDADGAREDTDAVAVEEPLEIRVGGEPLAITMRTPGDDANLALGFLFAEGVVRSVDDVGAIAPCGRPGDEGFGNAIDVTPGPGVSLDVDRVSATRRGTLTTSACGICGRRSIDDVLARVRKVPDGPALPATLVGASMERLRSLQPAFERTGGLHAAAAFDASGALIASAEDVGRHNAVDKVVGRLVREGRTGERAPALLCVSGRASFEIVQKAAAAGLRVVASVSAASSLAIDLSRAANVTLAAFARGGSLAVFSAPERLTLEDAD